MNTDIKSRIDLLRAFMHNNNLAAVIIPQADPHQSEYIAEHWQLRRWLSGFNGSAGTLVVTADDARLWTDSRYFLQAEAQLEGTGISLMKDGIAGTPDISEYIATTLHVGSSVGIDGLLFSAAETDRLTESLAETGITLNTGIDIAGHLWNDRPPLPARKIFIHELKYAGTGVTEKKSAILAEIRKQGAAATLISALDEIAWVLNIRCRDVQCNPVAMAFLYLSETHTTLFINTEKLDSETSGYLSEHGINIAPYNSVTEFIQQTPDHTVLIDKNRISGRLRDALGTRAVYGHSPVTAHKACRNATQIEGTRRAMERDGVALVKSFMEMERRLREGERLTEITISDILHYHRSRQSLYFDESFETIAGFGPHGAIVHYSATPETDVEITDGNLLLIDSGAQYLDGTTDITRTIAIGTPTLLQQQDFTLVLKGHIALARAIYPEGTRGTQLDILARQYLWQHGLNYLHGTGHGVGHFLNVHEGPQGIRMNDVPAPLHPGMVTSDEPGLYRTGVHGIRCENLLLTTEAFTTESGRFLKFETLTLFPFDTSLCLTSMMTSDEIEWLNAYHAEVYRRLSPSLNEPERQWLAAKTAPLSPS